MSPMFGLKSYLLFLNEYIKIFVFRNRVAGPLYETGLSSPVPAQALPVGPVKRVEQHLGALKEQEKSRRGELSETEEKQEEFAGWYPQAREPGLEG